MKNKDKSPLFVGIDPGITGAIASIDVNGNFISLYDSPFLEENFIKNGKKRTRKEQDELGMLDVFNKSTSSKHSIIILENVHSFPGEGVTSSFRFGVSKGTWIGILVSSGYKYEVIHPMVWKKIFPELKQQTYKEKKEASRQLAIELFPPAKQFLKFKKNSDRADALLMAEYLRRKYVENNG